MKCPSPGGGTGVLINLGLDQLPPGYSQAAETKTKELDQRQIAVAGKG